MKAVRRGQWLAARMVCGALAAMLAGATATQAHEIGTTRIVARFAPDDTYPIDVITDASVLPGSTYVNPQITIMAMAARSARHLASKRS